MILDFHAHTFPEKIADKAINNLSVRATIPYFTNATNSGIKASMERAGVDISLILPVVTAPTQTPTVNRVAIELNEREAASNDKQKLISFGGLHPDNANYKEIISELRRAGVKGIKLHPVFQNVYFDDIRYKRIVACAMENDLVVLTHSGYDLTYADLDFSCTEHIMNHVKDVRPDKLVLAHMGGYGCWGEIEEVIANFPIYIDTAFTMTHTRRYTGPYDPARDEEALSLGHKGCWTPDEADLSKESFLRLLKAAGPNRVLFGSDSPWKDQKESLAGVTEVITDKAILEKVLYNNAAALLSI